MKDFHWFPSPEQNNTPGLDADLEPIMKDMLYPEKIERAFLDRIARYDLDEKERIMSALGLAKAKHATQTRDEWTLYVSHCILVASLLIDESAGVNEVIIGLLHDTREDTDITDEELAPFGEEVSIGTLKLSKIRDWIKIPTGQYLGELQENEKWIRIKWADRLWNIFSLRYCPDEAKRKKYEKETREILLPIFYERAPEFAKKIESILTYVMSQVQYSKEEFSRLEELKNLKKGAG